MLDEATIALGLENERLVLASIETAAQGRTTISVTHSTEVMKTADRTIVLVEGMIVEECSFAELMGKHFRKSPWRRTVRIETARFRPLQLSKATQNPAHTCSETG